MPLLNGITMSIVVRSGLSSLYFSTASRPLAASPTTSNPPDAKMSLIMLRMKIASSTTRTRLAMCSSASVKAWQEEARGALASAIRRAATTCGETSAATAASTPSGSSTVTASPLSRATPRTAGAALPGAGCHPLDGLDPVHVGDQEPQVPPAAVQQDDLLRRAPPVRQAQQPRAAPPPSPPGRAGSSRPAPPGAPGGPG